LVLASNHNSETPPVNPGLELSKMNSNLKKRKIAYGCNHCDKMLLSRNLMREHLRRKHQTKPKNKTFIKFHYGIITCLVIYATKLNPTIWVMRLATLWTTNCVLIASDNTSNIPTIIYANTRSTVAHATTKRHELEFTHGLFLEALCGKIPEHSIIDICDQLLLWIFLITVYPS